MNITIDWAFNFVIGFCLSCVWYWVRGMSNQLKEANHDRIDLREELNGIKLNYQSREDAKEANRELMAALKSIEKEIKIITRQISEKEDRK